MADADRRDLGRVFNEVPELYDRVRPTYPDELFSDLVATTNVDTRSSVLEVGCGTGQATRSLAALGCSVTAVEPGAGMAELARQRLAVFPNVEVEISSFEEWDDRGRQFDLVVAASAWHWVDPSVGWRCAHDVLHSGGWMALLGNVVVRRPEETEVYAETADLHERFAPGNPGWGDPPLEAEVRATDQGWGRPNEDVARLFSPPIARWYPTVQWLDGEGFADLLRSTSLYRQLDHTVREPLLEGRRTHPHTDGRSSTTPLPECPARWPARRLTARSAESPNRAWPEPATSRSSTYVPIGTRQRRVVPSGHSVVASWAGSRIGDVREIGSSGRVRQSCIARTSSPCELRA